MPEPFASIIVPTYNQAEYLSAALESLIAQTDTSWEAIIVDDGSTDETPNIIRSFVQRDERFVSVRKDNGGTSSALNLGLSYAAGNWIHWLSSDDMFEASKLAINKAWIERNSACKFFFSYFSLLHEANGAYERRGLWGSIPQAEYQILTLLHRNYINGITVCIEREALIRAGGFDEALFYAQDFDLWIRLLKTHKAMFIPEWTVVTRVHALQGSTLFSDACYFDTAMAAVKFLNASSFQDLIPWTDLSDIRAVLAAIHTALDVSFDPTSFLYGLGPHSGLVLKTLHWISHSIEDPVVAQIANLAVEERINEAIIESIDDNFSRLWKNLSTDCKESVFKPFDYEYLDPIALGLDLYVRYRVIEDPRSEALGAYLRRFDNVNVPLPSASIASRGGGLQVAKSIISGSGGEQPSPFSHNAPLERVDDLRRKNTLLRASVVRMSEDIRGKIAHVSIKNASEEGFLIGTRLRSQLSIWYATIIRSASESFIKQLQERAQNDCSSFDSGVVSASTRRSSYESIDEIFDRHLVVASGLFDAGAYAKANDDVAQARIDPLHHFLKFGGREGRKLGSGFDAERYLLVNRDVADAGCNPLVHFLRYGFLEGRGLECLNEVWDKIASQSEIAVAAHR